MERYLLQMALLLCLLPGCGPGEEHVSFNRDIRPIFNGKCLRCHGGVRANGGFSLLFEEEALGIAESGRRAIVPGDHRKSELYRRIIHSDPAMRMPLGMEPLSEAEIDLIARWIDQGAEWELHWAYRKPEKEIRPPEGGGSAWIRNDIDRFIYTRFAAKGLSPAPEADKATLFRRLSLDLTGLPPAPEEARRFLDDNAPDAYEKLVDRLLASPHFGEHWAAFWLDLARYADTKGYEKDSNRSIWKYRDWVIQAFTSDMPFARFTVEQLAGDLLPDPSESQLIATAFHRNAISNDEGGTDDEEFRVASVIERVGTTYEVWQSTTMACAQCHSHPYDPFRQKTFYQSMAFFNNTADRDIYNEQPKLYTYSEEEEEKVAGIIDWITSELKPDQAPPRGSLLYERRSQLLNDLGYRVVEAEEYSGSSPLIELIWPDLDMVWQVQDSSWIRFEQVDLTGVDRIGFRAASMLDRAGSISIHLDSPLGRKIGEVDVTKTGEWDGWQWSKPVDPSLFKTFVTALTPVEGRRDLYFRFWFGDTYIQHLFYLDKIIYFDKAPAMAAYSRDFQRRLEELAAVPATMTPIMRDLPSDRARSTHLLERGSWLSPGEVVDPAIPLVFGQLPADAPVDRLGFARWLVGPDNPLTARVAVNRFWARLFGRGLVATMEEFGSQGAAPTHPELLDWLAVRFAGRHRWSIKSLLREWVSSATYRQASTAGPDKLEKDPDNRLLSRGPRERLSAEQIRDQILAVRGLLDSTIGGPSVIIPGLDIAESNIPSWTLRTDAAPYRRSLYTFWKRTDPFPSMITFDSPDRSTCTSRRITTNTPLQALILLNNQTYFEAAEALAARMAAAGGGISGQLRHGYFLVMNREAGPGRLDLLRELYADAVDHYQAQPAGTTQWKGNDRVTPGPHLAALTLVANALLNMDEFVVKK